MNLHMELGGTVGVENCRWDVYRYQGSKCETSNNEQFFTNSPSQCNVMSHPVVNEHGTCVS